MTTARTLRPGEALPLSDLGPTATAGLTVGLTAAGTTPDLVAMLVGDNGKVRTDDDLVFYNNPASADGGVTWTGQSQAPQWLTISPARLDADVDRVVLGAAGGLLEALAPGLFTVTVADTAGTPLAAASFQADAQLAAMILLEVYRRAGAWRLRLLAQGYAGGLAALVTEFGVDVDDPGVAAAPDSAPSAAPARALPRHQRHSSRPCRSPNPVGRRRATLRQHLSHKAICPRPRRSSPPTRPIQRRRLPTRLSRILASPDRSGRRSKVSRAGEGCSPHASARSSKRRTPS